MEEVLLHLDIQRKIQEQYLMCFQGAAEKYLYVFREQLSESDLLEQQRPELLRLEDEQRQLS